MLTVEAASRLLFAGGLDGRAAAVGGYWAQSYVPCPYAAHEPILDQFCYFAAFTDEPLPGDLQPFNAEQGDGLIEPMVVPESGSTSAFWNTSKEGTPFVLVGHAADSRLWQCAPDRRLYCGGRFVVDRFAWIDGRQPELESVYWEVSPRLSIPEAVAAATEALDATVLTAFPLDAGRINDVDPRLAGIADGVVWVVRVAVGAPDNSGTSQVDVRLVDDESASLVATLPLAVADDYVPGRITLESELNRAVQANHRDPRFSIEDSTGRAVAAHRLNMSTVPLALDPGELTLSSWIADDRTGDALGSECASTISLGEREDRFFLASFAGLNDCEWNEVEELPFM